MESQVQSQALTNRSSLDQLVSGLQTNVMQEITKAMLE